MYITREQIDTVAGFVLARVAEEVLARADNKPEHALVEAVRAARKLVSRFADMPPTADHEEAYEAGVIASTAWAILTAAAHTWRGHPLYPVTADQPFNHFLEAS
ncbi:hypothetical protein OG618_36970 (plasmid) [Kitasatospora sp. NBC_01246]|uniref:hypothetical protein n=1 Tax=Kitasatospora sp. NBC_01246 TaxID=2903570 RepID=UPI002E371EDF|nr:hypothetical protein [Kitasatospora sp. NBC_01246]